MTITKWVGSTQPPTTSRKNYFQHPIGVLDFQHPKTIEVTGEKFSACGCKDTKHWNTSALCEMDKFEAWEAVTPQKTNMEPQNTPLEKEKHLQTTNFWVPC